MVVKKQFHTSAGITERNLTSAETDPSLLAEYQKDKDISDSLPSWQVVSKAIDNAADLAMLKVIVKKIARVVYWTAKNSED